MKLKMVIFPLLWIWAIAAMSQKKLYQGEPVWFQREGATERFTYLSNDTLMRPDGEYTWKFSDEVSPGAYELVTIKSQMKKGQPHGDIEAVVYSLNFRIDDFSNIGVEASTFGEKAHLKGNYENGKPVGTWNIEFSPYGKEGEKWGLTYVAADRKWSSRGGATEFRGQTDGDGFFVGEWRHLIFPNDSALLRYDDGVLQGFSINSRGLFEHFFGKLRLQSAKADSTIPAIEYDYLPWIWSSGNDETDSVYNMQLPVFGKFDKALLPYKQVMAWLAPHPLFEVPTIKGTKRLYYALRNEEVQRILKMDLELAETDSSLGFLLESPVFLLRRAGNAEVDSLMKLGEGLQGEINRLRWEGVSFMENSARLTIPYHLGAQGDFDTHRQYVNDLIERAGFIKVEVDSLEHMMKITMDALLEQGAIEQLEEEWALLVSELKGRYIPEARVGFAAEVFEKFVLDDFKRSTAQYSILGAPEERKKFLMETVDLYRFLHTFFKEQKYLQIENVEPQFVKGYTQYWYNPYMGVNNVEVLVKKRLIAKIINEFWPYQIREMVQAEDSRMFMERYFLSVKYKEALLGLGSEKNAASHRLEKRIIREKSPENMEAEIEEYIKHIE